MELNEVGYGDGVPIDGYGPNGFRIAGELVEGPLFLRPGGPVTWGGMRDVATLLAAGDLVDVILIGTGAEIAPLPVELRGALDEAGTGVEFMATGPACRSYNVMLGEGRRVGLAVMPV